ncbi:MAG: 4Fe-4S binding protein [Candidatus Heimdallarchaeota archaeon]|nr:4Fe-4S binding protein [Candidatus Heimdallarchaeota archaeon]MCK4768802.1 4Fe-4S binding protein [Candidatus Heimdallarchaeota archaeon]
MGKIKIKIDYSICGDGNKIDPRDCTICLKVCDPAIFLLHQSIKYQKEDDPYDPKIWRVTPVYPSLCILCMKCVEQCPENAIKIRN